MPTFPASFLAVKDRADATLAASVGSGDRTWTVTTGEGVRFPDADLCIKACNRKQG